MKKPTLYNTPSCQKEIFTPLVDQSVKLYTCGPTVYGELHIGNWASYIRWDILVRMLRAHGYSVERVMNITDVGHLVSDGDDGEDKMEKGARREGTNAWEVSRRYSEAFLNGMQRLNLLSPEHLIKATDFIPQQIALIKRLEESGHTYVIGDGVYFDTSTFPRYAEFANIHLDALKAGARVAQNTDKRNASDFALWKFSPTNHQRDMEWDSPWGKGFPGWHLECSAIAMELLGQTLDIHTGGIDHIPVHHTNEIAQSEAATGKPFAKYWLHSNFLLVNGTKISKSLENGFTLDDIEAKGFSIDDFKMFVLQSHYRSESNFTWENMQSAANRLRNWRKAAELRWQLHDTLQDDEDKSISEVSLRIRSHIQKLLEVLSDDLNTPGLLMEIDRALDDILAHHKTIQQDVLESLLEEIEALTGLNVRQATPDIDDELKRLILERQRARDVKDYERSDSLREAMAGMGLNLTDFPGYQLWNRI